MAPIDKGEYEKGDFQIEGCYNCMKRINEMQHDHCNQEETPKPASYASGFVTKNFSCTKGKNGACGQILIDGIDSLCARQ